MLNLSPDKQILNYLSIGGIGNYVDVGPLLSSVFPPPFSNEQFHIYEYQVKILCFINELERQGLISLQPSNLIVITPERISIKASITPRGIDFHFHSEHLPTTNITVNGNDAQIANNSASSLFSNDSNNSIISKEAKKSKKRNSLLEKLYWFGGILIALIGLWQVFFPHFFNNDQQLKNKEIRPNNEKRIDSLNSAQIKKSATTK